MTEKDREAILEMIMDVSGARIAVEMALDIFNETNVSSLKDVIFEVSISST